MTANPLRKGMNDSNTGPMRLPCVDGAKNFSKNRLFGGWVRNLWRNQSDFVTPIPQHSNSANELLPSTGFGSGTHAATIDAQEQALIQNVLRVRDLAVVDCMVPRADIMALEADTTSDELVRLLATKTHSRLPVYRETLDEIVGVVHIRDAISLLARGLPLNLRDMVREVMIVAPSMRVLDLLVEMRETRNHMALVVDEYGGIDGLVTIEDLVEQIVGEIRDEHEQEERAKLWERPDGTLIADARLPIDEFEERVGPVLTQDEREDIDTLGGLVFALAGEVPSRGALLTHSSGLEFEVLDADLRRIRRLRVRNLPALIRQQAS